MYIITNKTIHFRNLKIMKDERTNENVATVVTEDGDNGEFIVQASPTPQFVPDWVVKDPIFDLSKEDGSILEVEIKNKETKAPKAPVQQDKSGWVKPEETGLESK